MAIVINSSTGEIDLDATTPSTYVVTYTVQGVSSTQEVTVNAVDNAGFSYSASSYAPTDADPTPTITGLTGGTFSAGSGLVFVDSGTNTGSSTGEIDLSASTVASYTITYDTTSSGSSVCPNTSTQTVEIAVAGISNVYSMNFDSASSDYIDAGNPTELQITGALTISYWFKTTNTGYQFLVTKDDGTNSCFDIGLRQQKIYATIYSSGLTDIQTTTTWTDGNWHNVVFVFTPSTSMEIFVDGNSEVIEEIGIPASIDNDPANLNIGRRGNSTRYYTGLIDEVGIWNTALTSIQIQDIYNATSTNLTKDLSTVAGGPVYWNRMGDN
jgi:hypothetical protein